jgi:hypothetical protein
MASPELASKLIATGSLDTNLNGISVKLKLTPFEPDPPKRVMPRVLLNSEQKLILKLKNKNSPIYTSINILMGN